MRYSLYNISKEITSRGGIVRSMRNVGLRHLTHKMRRHKKVATEAHYVIMRTECSPETREAINTWCRFDRAIMRWFAPKEILRKPVPMTRAKIHGTFGWNQPRIDDPVFDFPAKHEFRRMKYNAKREA